MMGSSGGSGGEFGNVYDLLKLVQDDSAYATKIAELDKRKSDVERTLSQSVENIKKAEQTNELAQQIMLQADRTLQEATLLKKQQDQTALELTSREKDLEKERISFKGHVTETEKSHKNFEDSLAVHEKELEKRKSSLGDAEDNFAQRKLEYAAEIEKLRAATKAECSRLVDQARKELEAASSAHSEADSIKNELEKRHKSYIDFVNTLAG